jgi:hypothetical protein
MLNNAVSSYPCMASAPQFSNDKKQVFIVGHPQSILSIENLVHEFNSACLDSHQQTARILDDERMFPLLVVIVFICVTLLLLWLCMVLLLIRVNSLRNETNQKTESFRNGQTTNMNQSEKNEDLVSLSI